MLAKRDDDVDFAFHACSYSSVQAIIHYGLHSNHGLLILKSVIEINWFFDVGSPAENTIHLYTNALDNHILHAQRSTDGRYYMFVVQLPKRLLKNDCAKLSNETAYLALPTHIIVYQREVIPW